MQIWLTRLNRNNNLILSTVLTKAVEMGDIIKLKNITNDIKVICCCIISPFCRKFLNFFKEITSFYIKLYVKILIYQ